MAEKRIPSMLLSILFTQVDDMMGRRSLIMLLRQAGLLEYVDNVPPMDDSPSITVEEYSTLLANIYEIFGARGARPIFLRGGRLGAVELRRQRPAQFAVSGMALKLLPTAKRMQLVLDKLVEQGEDMYGASYRLEEKDDAFFLSIADCPYCAEITRRHTEQNKPISKPVCYIPASIVSEMMEWATDQKHLVEEVACIAMGDPACRFRVSK
ncbi:MAG: 4-vinyl reductase [Anaerolineae bacterium]|jgi:predicted hydrocarbon binding protein